MKRRTLSCVLTLPLLLVACSGSTGDREPSTDGGYEMRSDAAESDAEDAGSTPTFFSTDQSAAFCRRAETLRGGRCRVRTKEEDLPSKWPLCADYPLAPLRTQYLVPDPKIRVGGLRWDGRMSFGETLADGSTRTVVTV